MERKFVRKDEQIKLIMECRQSGLSDYQWCRQQDINPGTFYNWSANFAKAAILFRIHRANLLELLLFRK